MDPWSMATAPLVAARCPCGHPPHQQPTRWLRATILWAREERPRRLEAEVGLPRLSDVTRLGPCQVYYSGLPLLTTRVLTAYQVYHSGLKLDDPLTKERTHDYLLFTSPRKVSRQQ